MGTASLPLLPLEIQVEVLQSLRDISPSTFASCLRLSRSHYNILSPTLYRHVSVRSKSSLEGLASTLACRPDLVLHLRSFFFQGPQGRRQTGRDQLRLLVDTEEEQIDEGEEDDGPGSGHDPDDSTREAELEPGVEGEGQEATWDEHETLMHLCTLVLRLCSDRLESIGFVDCVPWFLAPTEGSSALNFPLPQCKDFTGVTVGLFGLLPHLQRRHCNADDDINQAWTPLQRIHLIGGDFGSFALQRVLLSSPTCTGLTHLHITAPTLYRQEHHSHLVMHIVGLLRNTPRLKRISVGFLEWSPVPPAMRSRRDSKMESRMDYSEGKGTGEDSFERGQFKERQIINGFGPTDYDDRLTQCRMAYIRALPEALLQSQREDCTVAIVKLPFAEGTPVGFAGWILSHHVMDSYSQSRLSPSAHAMPSSWTRRDLSNLPEGIAQDGAPAAKIWQTEPTMEWAFDGKRLHMLRGKESPWMME